MPLTPAAFSAVQDDYKEGMAAAAGVNPQDVDILSVTASRRQGGSSDVETKIRAMDSAALKALGDTLGSGDAMLAKINAELGKRGLPASTGVKPGGKPALPAPLPDALLPAALPATQPNQTNQTDTLGIVLGVVLPVIFISAAAFAYRKYVYNPAAKDSTEAGSSLVIVVPPSAKVASPPPAPPPTQSAIPIRATTPPMLIAPVSGWGNPAIFSNQTPAKTFTGPVGATTVFVPSNQTPATLTVPAGATAVFSA
jgi:hypothetical protein